MEKIVVIAGEPRSLIGFRGLLLKAMVERGHHVVACAPPAESGLSDSLAALGVRFVSVPLRRAGMNPFRDFGTLIALRRFLCKEKPQVVFSYTIKPVVYGTLAARAARVPAIFSMITGAGYAFLREHWKQRAVGTVARPLYRAALSANRRVFFQNPDDLGLFMDKGLLREREQAVLVAGSGVDLAHFTASPPPVSPLVFLMAARFYREKGVLEYVEAARTLRQRHPSIRCRLVGAPDANPSAIPRTLIDRWSAEGSVDIIDWVPDLRPELSRCGVFVLPSYREGTPRSVLEAMATGRAVVTTDAPGCRETVVPDRNGFLVPIKDAKALAAAMERLIQDPQLVTRMGIESRRIAETKFDVHKVNAVMLHEMGL